MSALTATAGAPVPLEGAGERGGERRRDGQVGSVLAPSRREQRQGRAKGGREMIFVPFGSSPPPHSLVTKSTGTSLEQIISEGQYITAQAAGKAPKFTPWANNPLPIARFGDSIVVPSGRIPPCRWEAVSKQILAYSQGSCTWVPPR